MTRMRVFGSVYCILLGIILLLKLLLHWDASAWNLALALLFFLSGAFLLTGGFGLRRRRHVQGGGVHAFFHGSIALSANAPGATLLFSDADVEFSPPAARLSAVRCAFSSVILRIPEGYSVRTVCRSALSSVTSPAGDLHGFGERVLIIGDGLQTQLVLHCLFSSVRILD